MSTSATLWPCGTLSTSVRPDGNTVPAGNPRSFATIATLSFACMRIVNGAELDGAETSAMASFHRLVVVQLDDSAWGIPEGSRTFPDILLTRILPTLYDD